MASKHKFYPEEIERLREAWLEMIARRSEELGSPGENIIFW
jgi:hypothetical protein